MYTRPLTWNSLQWLIVDLRNAKTSNETNTSSYILPTFMTQQKNMARGLTKPGKFYEIHCSGYSQMSNCSSPRSNRSPISASHLASVPALYPFLVLEHFAKFPLQIFHHLQSHKAVLRFTFPLMRQKSPCLDFWTKAFAACFFFFCCQWFRLVVRLAATWIPNKPLGFSNVDWN